MTAREFDDDFERCLDDGIRLFNSSKYFEAHEVWEEGWQVEVGRPKLFLQALIQVAAGFFKAETGSPGGAVKLLATGREKLAQFRPNYAGIAVEPLIEAVDRCFTSAHRWSEGADEGFDFTRIPRIDRLE